MVFVPARKLSNKNSDEILANQHARNLPRAARTRLHQPEIYYGKLVVPG